jgi:staphylococcal nuclease domain-containing protein 1
MGRRPPPVESVPEAAKAAKSETNGGAASVPEPLTSAQRLAAANAPVEVAPDPFAREARHFTETR